MEVPTGADGQEAVTLVLLDGVPEAAWVRAFNGMLGDLIARYALAEVRLVGRSITLLGPLTQARRLAGDVRTLVHRVSRQQMRLQMTLAGRPASAPGAADVIHSAALQRDLAEVSGMSGIATLLEAVTQSTGMRFAAVARVTDTQWIACAVYDLIQFGLHPGQELKLETTICNEIRQHGRTVTFNRASEDAAFSRHPTPAMYGFESYVSIPIHRPDGDFFGTLCALDPDPARLDADTLRTLELFAGMIGQQLEPKAIQAPQT